MRRYLRGLLIGLAVLASCELGLRFAGDWVLRYWSSNNEPFKDGDVTVLCLGESTTAGLWVDPLDSYPKQLERKLRTLYANDRIRVVVPPHIGQNSSQQANRISKYIDTFHPSLVILMSGANNEWSLAESHVTRFVSLLHSPEWSIAHLELRISLDRIRVFKAARNLYLRASSQWDKYVALGRNDLVVWGGPEIASWPPEYDYTEFATKHHDAFVQAWRYDMKLMASEAHAHSIPVLLMSYPVRPNYLRAEDFRDLAAELSVPLVENQAAFDRFRKQGIIDRYVFEQDHWHPNSAGYGVVSDGALRMIEEHDLLRQSSKRASVVR